jgi:cysteine desulfurase
VASAHKFHGPKGVGFAFIRKNSDYNLFHGGEQEKATCRNRGFTSNCRNGQGLSVSYDNLEQDREHISSLRLYLIAQLDQEFAGYEINGSKEGFYTILNLQLFRGQNSYDFISLRYERDCSFSRKRLSKR